MKKLLLLLFLSFFSIQSYAGSCPDGSDPVRSISDDGTYFVFNCESDTKINVNVQESGAGSAAQGQFIIITKFYGMTLEDQNTHNILYAP